MILATKPATVTSTSAIISLMSNYVLANQWAIETIITWLRTKPVDAIEKEIPSSFAGIRETLVHIWDTERFWLSVIKKEEAPESFRMSGFRGTLEEAFEGAQKTSKEFSDFVTSLSEEELSEQINLDTPWVQGTRARYEFVQHCMNHSSYHRGQLVTLGHHVGFHDAPMTDFNFYLMVIKG